MSSNTAARTEQEQSVSKLQLTERRSPITVTEIKSIFHPNQMIVREFGDMTFILSPGERLHLVDSILREIPEFAAINNPTVVDWKKIKGDDSQYEQLSFSRSAYTYVKSIDDCPADLQLLLIAYMRSANVRTMRIPDQNWGIDNISQTHQVISGNDFILFHNAEDSIFVAYSTTDAQGQPIQPKNWQRYDNKDEHIGRLPAKISEQVKQLREQHQAGIKHIKTTQEFAVLAYDDKISVVKTGNSINQAEFSDNIPVVRENICVDPKDSQTIYYCSSGNATQLFKLRMEGDPKNWKPESIPIKQAYPQISNLQLDPTGTAFMFETGNEVVLVEKNSFTELKKVPLKKAIFDKQGKIRGVDLQGRFVVMETNLASIANMIEKRKVAQMAAGIDVQELFQGSKKIAAEESPVSVNVEVLSPIKDQCEASFLQVLTRASDLLEVTKSLDALQALRNQLLERGFTADQVSFITEGIAETISLRQQVLANHEAGKLIKTLEPQIDPNYISTSSVQGMHQTVDGLNALSSLLDTETRNKISRLTERFNYLVGELYRRQGEAIQTDLGNTVAGLKTRLEQMHSRAEISDWREMDYPMLKEKLAILASDCPVEAYEIHQKIIKTRREMEQLVQSYEDKFRREYAQIREKAADAVAETVTVISSDISGLMSRMTDRQFSSVEEARIYISSNESRALIEREIEALAQKNPERATELSRALKVSIANLYSEINRAARIKVAETGQRMESFGPNGEIQFPIWEQKTKTPEAVHKRQVSLIFIPDEKSKGPGVTLDKIYGDVGIMYIDAKGKLQKVRLFEGDMYEDLWRYGQLTKSKRGIPHTYMAQGEFVKLKQEFDQWEKPISPLRAEFDRRKAALAAHIQTRPKDQPVSLEWQAEMAKLSSSYNQFIAEHSTTLMLLSRFNKIKNTPETQSANGKGYVPQMENHWVVDEDTEETLAKMAKHFHEQLDLKEGLLMLKGHAGTGKDVLVKIFCARTRRMYFGFDCSKWTTDEDMTQVILLDASEGATKTIKIPSAVLNAIQTPGSILYFNEFNAMPEDTQIFLHSLLDEKRSITLKTESGKVIKSDPSVLIAASMNPGYKGTSDLQIATRSRMVEMEIGYPPLLEKNKPGDNNPNSPYSPSEALRIARGVTSLVDLTLDKDEFVRVWDHEINRLDTGSPTLNTTQDYDLKVVLALVQFSNRLREFFIKIYEKTPGFQSLIPVTLPITGREMRRAAYALSQIPDSIKELQTVNPEAMARSLIDTYFLCHFDKAADRDKIRVAMQQWPSEKRKPG